MNVYVRKWIQLYSDDAKTKKAYPIVNASGVFDENGENPIDILKNESSKVTDDLYGKSENVVIDYKENLTPKTDGTFYEDTSDNASWLGSGYVEIPNDVMRISYLGASFFSGFAISPIAFYDSDKNFISCVKPIQPGNGVVSGIVEVPSNAKYFVQTKLDNNEGSDNYTIYHYAPNYGIEKIGQVDDKVDKEKLYHYTFDLNETTINFDECINEHYSSEPLFTNGFVAESDIILQGVKTLDTVKAIGIYVSNGTHSITKEWKYVKDSVTVINGYADLSEFEMLLSTGDEVFIKMYGTFKYSENGTSEYKALSSLNGRLMVVNYYVSFNLVYGNITGIDDLDYKGLFERVDKLESKKSTGSKNVISATL